MPKLKMIAWLLIALACLRVVLSRFLWHFPDILLELLAPYIVLAVGLRFVRTEKAGRWAIGLSGLLASVTFVSVYAGPREFWQNLSLWIHSITVCQMLVGGLFVFGALCSRPVAEPCIAPNGGPAQRFGNSGIGGGPPSMTG